MNTGTRGHMVVAKADDSQTLCRFHSHVEENICEAAGLDLALARGEIGRFRRQTGIQFSGQVAIPCAAA